MVTSRPYEDVPLFFLVAWEWLGVLPVAMSLPATGGLGRRKFLLSVLIWSGVGVWAGMLLLGLGSALVEWLISFFVRRESTAKFWAIRGLIGGGVLFAILGLIDNICSLLKGGYNLARRESKRVETDPVRLRVRRSSVSPFVPERTAAKRPASAKLYAASPPRPVEAFDEPIGSSFYSRKTLPPASFIESHLSRNRQKRSWQNRAIQIACRSRKTSRFLAFWRRPRRFDAAVGVTAACKLD